jgi:type IV secretory pathway TrbL component
MFSRYTFYGGRRKSVRREEDKKRHRYVDIYSPRLFSILLSILIVSCVDAYLTLLMIEKKVVTEGNPVMAFYMEFGTLPFFAVKYSLTAIPVIILCILKNSFITRVGLLSAMVIYLVVVLYELHIVYRLHPPF